MRKIAFLAVALSLAATTLHANSFDAMFPDHPGYEEEDVNRILATFDYRDGTIRLPGGQAILSVPEGYYYLNPEDAGSVLFDLWGNEPSTTLGMIFPSRFTPWDDEAWGVEIDFDALGYVSDEDAATIDYDDLLAEMQADLDAGTQARIEAGYQRIELIGWAETPHYDRTERKLHWAKEVKFGDSEINTLNYNLRALGREGVLYVNFIASMEQLPEIKAALPDISAMIDFADGKTYADFDPSVDTVAAYGIAGLIAGKALASKAGFLAAALLLLKKFWFVLLLPLVWLKSLFRRQ